MVLQMVPQGEISRRSLFVGFQGLPQPKSCQWLIDGILPQDSVVLLYGGSGLGKTFVALDMAFSVAHGIPWNGHAAARSDVCLILAEDFDNASLRTMGWHAVRKQSPNTGNFFYSAEVPDLRNRQVLSNIAQDILSTTEVPGLIVVDNLARFTARLGLEENNSSQMGSLMQGFEDLRRKTGTTILLLHHTDKQGKSERGSSAIRGAADAMLCVSQTKGVYTITCNKQRNAARFESIAYQLDVVSVAQDLTTCIPSYTNGGDVPLTDNQQKVYDALRATPAGMRWGEIVAATGLSGGTLKTVLDFLAKKKRLISFFAGLYSVVSPSSTPDIGRSEGVIITPSKTDLSESGKTKVGRPENTQNLTDRPNDLPQVDSVRSGQVSEQSVQVENSISDLTDQEPEPFCDECYLSSDDGDIPEMPPDVEEHFRQKDLEEDYEDDVDIDHEDFVDDGEPDFPLADECPDLEPDGSEPEEDDSGIPIPF